MLKKQKAFTIVELLVAIVVIGILAAISVVSYNGIQTRARDTLVKNDMSNFGKTLELYKAEYGSYIHGLYQLNDGFGSMKISDRSAYGQSPLTVSNITACFAVGGEEIAVAALTASNKFYYIYSGEGFNINERPISDWHHSDNTAQLRCQAIDPDLSPNSATTGQPMNFNGYNSEDTVSGPWRRWTTGE